MWDKLVVISSMLIVVLSSLKFLEAEEYSARDLLYLRKQAKDAGTKFDELIVFNASPLPASEILDIINKRPDVISLKDSLDGIFPFFWKVPRRKECAKLMNQRTQLLIKAVSQHEKSRISTEMNDIMTSLNSFNMSLNNSTPTKSAFWARYSIEYLHYRMDSLRSSRWYHARDTVAGAVKSMLILPVEECLDE